MFAAAVAQQLAEAIQIVTRYAAADADVFRSALDTFDAELTVLPAETTSGFSLDYTGEEREMDVTRIGETWLPEDAAALAPEIEWVHVAPLLRSDFPAETLASLAEGRRVSLDAQGLVRAARVGRLAVDAHYDPAVLDAVTALKLSEDEARIVSGGAFDRSAAERLGVPEVLLTLGSHGAVVFVDDGETFVPAAWPVLGVQTTGAGDAFMVGYAVARTDGQDPVGAARAGSRLVAEMLEERKQAAAT